MQEVQLGKYRLLKLLATGGMGEVFLARQEGPAGFAKTVVIKRMLTHLGRDPHFVEMFLNEARLAAQLSHPNIVQIFELGEQEGTYFLAMEFIHGVNLRSVKLRLEQRHVEVPVGIAAWICSQALKGLHYAHTLEDEQGTLLNIVHRDVSPDNVLVGFNGTVKLVDFGIAKASNSAPTTAAGTVKGKYAYMSPELLSGQKAEPRTDVYAMGIVLYELLTGARPFQGDTEAALVKSILHDTPQRMRALRPSIPPDLEEITLRAIARNPEERFQSAESMATALESFALVSGGTSQESVKALLRGLFGDDTELISLVTPRPKPSPLPSPVGPRPEASPAPVPAASGERAAAPTELNDGLWVSVDLSTQVSGAPVAAPMTEAVPAPAAAAPPPQAAEHGARRKRPWLWLGVGATLVAAGASVVLPTLRSVPALAPRSQAQARAGSQPTSAAVPPSAPEPAEAVVVSTAPAAPPPQQAAAPTPEPAPARPETQPAARRSARPATQASTGTVALRVNPWAEVLHNGKSLGVTPMAPIELPSGKQTLILVNKDLDVEKKVRVVVPAGREVMLRVNLLDEM